MRERTRRKFLGSIGGLTGTTLVALGSSAGVSGSSESDAGPPSQTGQRDVDPALFPSEERIRHWHDVTERYTPRPTASPTSHAYFDWLESQLAGIDAIDAASIETEKVPIDRQLEERASLAIQTESGGVQKLPLVRGIPYSKPTTDGVATGPLTYVEPDQSIEDADVAGKVVVRDLEYLSLPGALFLPSVYYMHDLDGSMTRENAADFERGWFTTFDMNSEIMAAARNGAAGFIYVHDFPRDQKRGHYRPYQAIHFDVPALQVGVDEGERLKYLARAEEDHRAKIRLQADRQTADARIMKATVPGFNAEKISVVTHTDGPNVLEENGPIVLLALANYFSQATFDTGTPRLARNVEFVFVDSHMYGSIPGRKHAREMNEEYERGELDLVITPEHFGATEWQAVSRDDAPGRRLERTGNIEPWQMFCHPSPVLVEALAERMIDYDLQQSMLLRGQFPDVDVPPYDYASEGYLYQSHGIPTVSAIAGPWTLFDPAFGTEELVDIPYFRRQAMLLADFIHFVDTLPRQVIAGGNSAYRAMMDSGLAPRGTGPSVPSTPEPPDY